MLTFYSIIISNTHITEYTTQTKRTPFYYCIAILPLHANFHPIISKTPRYLFISIFNILKNQTFIGLPRAHIHKTNIQNPPNIAKNINKRKTQ